ncbi:apolipoprotein L2 [Prionailurus iriomotensis]
MRWYKQVILAKDLPTQMPRGHAGMALKQPQNGKYAASIWVTGSTRLKKSRTVFSSEDGSLGQQDCDLAWEQAGVRPVGSTQSDMEDIIEYFQDSVSQDDLHLLLTDHEAWESFMAEANLSREEADVLHAGLCELEADLCMEGRERIQRDHLEERFLNEYPRLKRELKGQIRKLHKLADKVDKVHRGCTISNIVASSTGMMSGVLTILGLSLAPVTSGISLSLLATGVGLRTASAVTTVSSSIVEYSSTSSAEAKARRLASAGDNRGETIAKALCQNTP